MKAATPWITYRTRFLVKGRQLTNSLTFTDLLGRQHSGRKGDYLVESSDGVLSITPKRIFEDIYVPVLLGETPIQDDTQMQPGPLPQHETLSRADMSRQPEAGRQRGTAILSLPPHLTRKSPQPYRERRNPSQVLRSL